MMHRVILLKRRTQLLGLCLASLCLAAVAERAHGYDPTARYSLAGTFGLDVPSMSDVNDRLGIGNEYMATQDWIPIDDINSLFAMGYDVRAELFGNWMLSVGGGRVFGNRGVDFDEVIDVEPSANLLHVLAIYRLPWRPAESIRMAAGAGFVTATSATLSISHEHRNVEAGTERIEELEIDLSGSGGLAFLEAEFIMTERFTLSLDAGYRFLNTTQDSETWTISRLGLLADGDSDGDEIPNREDLTERSYLRHSFLADEQLNSEGRLSDLDAADFDVDFSGPTVSIALRVYLF